MCFSLRKISPESKGIDRDLKKSAKDMVDSKKILLLGAGDTGKTTFAKQLVFSSLFQQEKLSAASEKSELKSSEVSLSGDKTTLSKQTTMKYADPAFTEKYIDIARLNVLAVFKEILAYLKTLEFDFPALSIKYVNNVLESSELAEESVLTGCLFLRDKCGFIRKVLEDNGNNLNIPGGREGGEYFLEGLERIADPEYIPTKEDILRARTKTTGINETNFSYMGKAVTLVDVGGQRSERRKWLPSFSGVVSAVIYIVSLSDYNTVLEEDKKTNRLLDSVQLFHSLQSSPYLESVPFIIFLNKVDIFKTKIVEFPLSEVFKNYPKDPDDDPYENGIQYVSQLFRNAAAHDPYIYPTCALDTDCCVKVFRAIFDHMTKSALMAAGFGLM